MNAYIRSALAISTIAFTLSPYLALADGPSGSGGGDPHVAEFLDAAKTACRWMGQNQDLRQYSEKCESERADLEQSVNSGIRTARVSSTTAPVKDSNGVDKDAVTNLKTRTVQISIPRWSAETLLEHQMTAAMELSILIGIPNRYDVGQLLMNDSSSPLLGFSSPVPLLYIGGEMTTSSIPDQGTVTCMLMTPLGSMAPTYMYLNEKNNYFAAASVEAFFPGYPQVTYFVNLAMDGNLDITVSSANRRGGYLAAMRGLRIPAIKSAVTTKLFDNQELEIYCNIGS